MTPAQRVMAVVNGETPDRPPVSCWHHFPPHAQYGQAALEAHLKLVETYNVDFLKVMNDNPYPTDMEIDTAADLRGISVLSGNEEGSTRQLELLRSLADKLPGQLLLVTTIFNAWAVLRKIIEPRRSGVHVPPVLGGPVRNVDARLSELLSEDRSAVAAALDAISTSLAKFARSCVDTGAAGIFLSVRDDWVNNERNGMTTYQEIITAGDLRILQAVQDAPLNILHVCGVPQDLKRFAAYPIEVINWADRAAGPKISEVINDIRPVVCAGVDNLATLPRGTPSDIRGEVRDALRQAGDRPIMISPGCTYDPEVVPVENIRAMFDAVQDVE